MRDSVESAQTVQRIDQPSNEADDIIVPAGIVYPSPEDKFLALMRRSASDDRNKDHEPADLEVEERELVQCGDNPIPKEDNAGCQDVEDLVDDECLPRLDLEVGVV